MTVEMLAPHLSRHGPVHSDTKNDTAQGRDRTRHVILAKAGIQSRGANDLWIPDRPDGRREGH
jgi:hypothetical protein